MKGQMHMKPCRTEHDLVGTMAVPAGAYYGIHSMRAAENFSITGRRLPPELIRVLAQIKKACAQANAAAGVLTDEVSRAICDACGEIIAGRLHDQFIVDPIQGGAGTSANMNANEVIANRTIELLGGEKGDYALVHPNDHVNASQSTNDVYPTAIRLTLYAALVPLCDALDGLIRAFEERANAFADVVTLGRTQLQDAVPMRFGQIFSAYAAVMKRERGRVLAARERLAVVNLGGTAVGTGLNAPAAYLAKVVPALAAITGYPLSRSADCVDATQNADDLLALSAALKGCGMSLSKICNDLRLLSSGPSGGFGDLLLPARQNGSSIMPGKVNPVIPEVVSQIAFRLAGMDITVTMAAEAGQLSLNAFEPVMFDSLYQGCTELERGVRTLTAHCIRGVEVNRDRCRARVDACPVMATALAPRTGYAEASRIAALAQRTGRPVRDIALEEGVLTVQEADELLDPLRMTDALEK